jgi:hypothetical protein
MKKNFWVLIGCVFTSLILPELAAASLSAASLSAASDDNAVPPADPSAQVTEGVGRWLSLNDFSFSMRYRGVSDSEGVHEISQGQQRTLLDGRLKLDKKGKYAIGFHVSSGKYFNWAYADFMGGGTVEALPKEVKVLSLPRIYGFLRAYAATSGYSLTSGGWAIYVRQLYLSAQPIDGVEFQYGGIGINRGVNTEITSYDDDGYIAGERVIVRRPQNLFFDEVSVTYAYLGDILTPNFFERGNRLLQSNYHQFLARKHVGKRFDFSGDYTWQYAHSLREAALIRVPETKALDSVRAEAYQRLNATTELGHLWHSGNGYAITAEKSFNKRVKLQAGWADIDYDYSGTIGNPLAAYIGFALNGDSMGEGRRFFIKPSVQLTPYLNAFGFYTHTVDFTPPLPGFLWNTQALNAGVTLDFKQLLPKSWH